jgi:hypothetical protein
MCFLFPFLFIIAHIKLIIRQIVGVLCRILVKPQQRSVIC